MNKEHKYPYKLDFNAPRLAWYKQKAWTRHQDTVYWVDIQLAQRKGLKFYQTRCNAIILYDTLPAYCISRVIVMKSEEIIYQKVCVSPRPPPTISYKDNWTCNLDSDVARSSKYTQRIQPKPKTPMIKNEETRRWARIHQGNQALNKNGETRRWIRIHTKLRVDACQNWRRRSNKNGETRKGGGARHWLQSIRIVTCSCFTSRKSQRSRGREEDRKSSSSRSTSSRVAAE